jgi:hypothetical protein
MKKLTKAQAQAYMRRWRLVNRVQRDELRRTPQAVKFQQLCALFSSAKTFGWEERLAAEDAIAHEWWSRLQKAYLAR